MKTGLILEGGAMRGMYTAGVIDVFLEQNILVDGLIGVSAGAVFGCNYKSRQPGRAIRYNKKYCRDSRYVSIRSLIKTGDLYGADFCYRQIPDELDVFDVRTFATTPMAFYVVCTDVQTGQPVYHRCDKGDAADIQWMRASASMPMVSRLIPLEGYLLSDGGTADSIPVRYFQQLGYARNIVVLTQPAGYVKQKNKYLPLIKILLRRYPAMVQALAHRQEGYNETLAYIQQQERAGTLFVLRPSHALQVGAVEKDPEKLEAVYQCGRKDAMAQLDALQAFIARGVCEKRHGAVVAEP